MLLTGWGLWDAETGRLRGEFPSGNRLELLTISPDGRHFAACERGEVRIWTR